MAGIIKFGHAQLMGAREDQEDAFGFSDLDDLDFIEHGGAVAVVADGIGGHAFGAEASQLAVNEFLLDYMARSNWMPIPVSLLHALQAANRAVAEFAKGQGETTNCGTTLVAAALHPSTLSLYWISGGDSRVYLLRDKQLVQLTSDCNYAGQLVKKMSQGAMTRDEVKAEAKLQALTCFLGMKKLDEVDRAMRPFKIRPQDWIVLCSDGVYNALDAAELIECLQQDQEPREACLRLMQAISAKNQKNQDNATVTILAMDPAAAYTESATHGGESKKETIVQKTPAGPIANDAGTRVNMWLLVTLMIVIAGSLVYGYMSF